MITKISIRNYRLFRELDLDFVTGMNIVVGDNASGKSTLIEAINLALTGRVQGRFLSQDFSPFLINMDATRDYIKALQEKRPAPPPEVILDLFLKETPETEILRGNNNVLNEDACGIRIRGYLSQDYREEYEKFISQPEHIRLVPTEYYKVEWLGFSGNSVSARDIPATASVIDPTTIRLQSGTDHHLQEIIRTHLDPKERVELSREYRSLREAFGVKESVKSINQKLAGTKGSITNRELTLSIDLSHRFTWENSLVAHLDDLPFQFVGKGEQNTVKTLLAIGQRAEDAHIVLIEEPENHLSFSSLRQLISKIEERCEKKQVIIATHSSFVLNKLGLDHLLLLGNKANSRFAELSPDTIAYFKKLSGYDTLRLVLAKRAILVEGPSDELIIQRAYWDSHGKLPIDDGIDVINVCGLTFKRYLDLAVGLQRRVAVVTDNDGTDVDTVRERYSSYASHDFVSVHVGESQYGDTLEPQIVEVNDLAILNKVLGRDFISKNDVTSYMKANKTDAALAIFESELKIQMPGYILEAVR